MAKFSKQNKLTKKEQEDLLIEFCEAISALRKPEEAAQFLKDILSAPEADMLAKRLRIAKLLLNGSTYESVRNLTGASPVTVARVSEWLRISGDGYRLVASRAKKRPEKIDPQELYGNSWKNFKRKHTAYYWPELLLEDFIKSADEKKRAKLLRTLKNIDQKSALYKDISEVFGSRAS